MVLSVAFVKCLDIVQYGRAYVTRGLSNYIMFGFAQCCFRALTCVVLFAIRCFIVAPFIVAVKICANVPRDLFHAEMDRATCASIRQGSRYPIFVARNDARSPSPIQVFVARR